MASSLPTNPSENPKSAYGKVVMSLENCILPKEKLFPTPSFLDGLDRESETDLRILGCELIQTSGILLKLPQVAVATGQILFQRFYYSESFVRQRMEFVAMACVTLASKIEEAPRRIRDVINVFHHIKQVRSGKTIQPLILDQNYINYKNQVIKAERRVLIELGFCVHVKHPHKIIVTLLEILKVNNHELLQTAWNYMNDSLRSEVFLRYHPEAIACACIYLSAKLLQIPLPRKPAWYQVFGVSEEDIHSICHIILSLYTRKKPDGEKLEKMVEQLQKAHEEAKLKAKALSSMGSDSTKNHSFSPVALSPKSMKLPAIELKKDKDIENGDVSKSGKESNHRKKTYSPVGDVSLYTKKRTRSTSSDSASSQSPHSLRHTHKSLPRSYKKTRRSRSRSKTHDGKKSKHHSSHKKKVNRSYSRSPRKRSSKKDRNGDRSPYRSNTRSHHSGHEKHRKDR